MNRPADLPASNHYHGHKKPQLLAEYAYLYPGVTADPKRQPETALMVSRALALTALYRRVSATFGIPWCAIAAVDMRESGCDPMGCLANGDRWDRKTIHYPANNGPWASKEASCDWALGDHESGWGVNLRAINWSIPEILYFTETFNGFGPRIDPGVIPNDASPYVYSGALFEGKPLYEKGKRKEKIGSDGKMHGYWDTSQVDEQIGTLIFLKALEAKGFVLTA